MDTITCLVCKATEPRILFADICPRKGALEYSVRQTLSNIKRLGFKRMCIKTDQEPALVALASA
eukprot:1436362-Heterocapsa_arctica.AAC.1